MWGGFKEIMQIPSLVELLEAGVHFGHKTSRWHPKMKPFIYTERSGVHVLDLQKTQEQLTSVLAIVKQMATEGKTILFVTTKPQAKTILKAAAIDAQSPFLVDRWIGGLLTNFSEFRRLLKKYMGMKTEKETGEWERYTKKERVRIDKELEKMSVTLGGLQTVENMPGALFIPSVQKEKTAISEANKMGVPIFGICDSNANPDKITYPIPANDDAVKSLTLIINLFATAIKEGKAEFEKKKLEVVK